MSRIEEDYVRNEMIEIRIQNMKVEICLLRELIRDLAKRFDQVSKKLEEFERKVDETEVKLYKTGVVPYESDYPVLLITKGEAGIASVIVNHGANYEANRYSYSYWIPLADLLDLKVYHGIRKGGEKE